MTSTGAGTLTVEAAAAAIASDDYSKIKADTLKLTTAQTSATVFKVNESTVVNLADTIGSTGAAKIDVDNGTSTSIVAGAGTLNVNVSQSQASLTTGAAVGTLLLKATPDNATDTKDGATITIGDLVANAKTSTVVVSGSEALTLSDVTHTEDLVVTSTQLTGKLVVTDTSSTADKDLTIIGGTNDDKVTMTVANNTVDTNYITLAGAGNDTLTVKGTGTASTIVKLYGEDGDDTINASALGTAAKEIILDGGAGNDTITGSALVDTIVGGAGNDTIISGAGADKITLGAGNDTVIVVAGNGNDVIADAVIGEDTIVLRGSADNTAALDVTALTVSSGNYVAKLGAAHAFTLTGSTATNLSGLVQFGDATLAYTAVANLDLTTGSKNDVVTTGATSGKINLGAGDDKITVTADTTGELTGGAGSDTFNIGANAVIKDLGATDILNISGTDKIVAVTVVESFTATAQTVNSASATAGVTLTLNQGVDIDMTLATVTDTVNDGYTINTANTGDYKLTDGATITGSIGLDIITGSDFDDIITGGNGADKITGGKGADTISLSETVASVDTVVFGSSLANNGVDTITGFTAASSAATGDKLDFDTFINLGTANTGVDGVIGNATTTAQTGTAVITSGAITGGTAGTDIKGKVVILDSDDVTSTGFQALITDSGTTTAFTLADTETAVILYGNVADGAQTYSIYMVTGATGATDTIELVGTVSVDDGNALVANQFI